MGDAQLRLAALQLTARQLLDRQLQADGLTYVSDRLCYNLKIRCVLSGQMPGDIQHDLTEREARYIISQLASGGLL